ncbi:MAG: DNA methyltransferase, partial [Chloroflexota bacterium]
PDPEGQAPVTSEFSDIDLRRWKERSDIILDSLWLLGARAKDGPHAPDYWGNFVPQIPRQVLQRFTRRGELAVDLFSGMGTTLIECRHLGRHGIGLELNPAVAERSRERIAEAANSDGTTTSVLVGDATSPAGLAAVQAALASAGREHADCVFLHPPYFDIIRFGEDPRDLSNAPTLDTFLAGFRGAVANAYALLRPWRWSSATSTTTPTWCRWASPACRSAVRWASACGRSTSKTSRATNVARARTKTSGATAHSSRASTSTSTSTL